MQYKKTQSTTVIKNTGARLLKQNATDQIYIIYSLKKEGMNFYGAVFMKQTSIMATSLDRMVTSGPNVNPNGVS